MPRIAVIMPAYNRAKVIGQAIDSVLAQNFGDFELIVVDDASSDGTADVARAYDDPRIRVIALRTNGGSNAARNAGIRAARAPLLAFLDSDDFYLPAKLSSVLREFDARPDLDVLVDSFVKNCSPQAKRRRIERRNPRVHCTRDFATKLFARELWKATSAITVKREAALRAGLFDDGVARRQDMEFLIRLTEVANCGATDEILWVKSWSPDGISAGDAFVASTLDLVRRHPQYLANRDYRSGLARDLARHVLIQLRDRRYSRALADARLMRRELGLARSAGLILGGTTMLAARGLRRREPSPEPASPSAPPSPAPAAAPARARRRA